MSKSSRKHVQEGLTWTDVTLGFLGLRVYLFQDVGGTTFSTFFIFIFDAGELAEFH